MPPPPPEKPGRRGRLFARLPQSGAIGAIMGYLADKEGSGVPTAIVVGVVGCAIVLGMLAFVNRSS
jgi:hypothetical protein